MQTLLYLDYLIYLLPVFNRIILNTKLRFANPLLVLLITFAIFSSQFFPSIYALGTIEMGRLQNQFFLTFQLFWFINAISLLGYLQQRRGKTCSITMATGIIILAICLISFSRVTIRHLNGVRAIYDIGTGVSAEYSEQMERRNELYNNNKGDIVLSPITAKPFTVYLGDLSEDEDEWMNRGLANFYGIKSVRVEYDDLD